MHCRTCELTRNGTVELGALTSIARLAYHRCARQQFAALERPHRERLAVNAGKSKGGGRKIYLVALAIAQFAAFTRSVVLARLLGPEQVGLAAVIVVTAQFFDSVSDTGNDRFLIQDPAGDSPRALELIHLVSVVKGLAIATLLIVLAHPIALFMKVPQVYPALAVLAIVPLISGFTNFRFRVSQRHHHFGGEAKVLFSSEICGLVATAAAAFVLRQFTAVLFGLAARSLAGVLVSQMVAQSPYRLRYSKEFAQRLWRFGAPLMVNGLLLFAATQSDRVIISRSLGPTDLGRYSVLLLLGVYPSATIMKFAATLFLPQITPGMLGGEIVRSAADRLESVSTLLSLAMAVGFAWFVPLLLPLIFGTEFRASRLLVTLVALIVSWRMMKTAPTTIAIAAGKTEIVLVNNLSRLSGVIAAILGLEFIGGLEGVALGLIVGEIIANTTATLLLNWKLKWHPLHGSERYALFGTAGFLLIAFAYLRDQAEPRAALFGASLCVLVVCAALVRERATFVQFHRLVRQKARP